MNQQQVSAFTMLRNVQGYMNATADKHPILANTGVSRRRLDEIITNLATHMAEQEASAILLRGATEQQRACRVRLLYRHMLPISRIANTDLDEPVRPLFRMPRKYTSVCSLTSIARGMANAAVTYAADFIAAGLPLDFIIRLERATERLLASVNVRAHAGSQHAGRTATIRTLFAEARKLLDVIDAFVTAALRSSPAELPHWKATRRLRSPGGHRPAFT